MSWETLLLIDIGLTKDCTDYEIKRLLEFSQEVLELKDEDINITDYKEGKVIDIRSLNFTSHVNEESCDIFMKYAIILPFISYLSISLYYISEADYDIEYNKGINVKEKIKELNENIEDNEKDSYYAKKFLELFPEYSAEVIELNI